MSLNLYNQSGDCMFKTDFIITKIDKIILVDDNLHGKDYSNYSGILPSNELNFVFSGNTDVNFNNSSFKLKENDVYFLPRGKVRPYEVFRNTPSLFIDIYFQSDVDISETPILFDTSKTVKLRNLFEKAFNIWVSREAGYYYKSIGILYDIISELQREKYIPEKKFQLIKPAIEYINSNFTESDFPYPYLAELCNISYSYLSRIFIEKFGVSPQKYITQLRINYACDLLKSGIYNVTQTAELVGIPDIYFFNKIFKEQIGMPPGKYKNSV